MSNGELIKELKEMADSDEISTKGALKLLLVSHAEMYKMFVQIQARITRLEKSEKKIAAVASVIAVVISSTVAIVLSLLK